MKRSLESSDSLGALISMCPSTDEHSPRNNNNNNNNHVYTMMLDGVDEEGCLEESGNMMMSEKKRRLSVDQVKALEKNFEVENKLEPERKVKLAQELGLQPRQVAVWFQNRRARWKTKQLERDYGVLKANYDSLKLKFDSLHQDNEALLKEIRELKFKLKEEDHTESDDGSVKEEEIMTGSESGEKNVDQVDPPAPAAETAVDEMNYGCFTIGLAGGNGGASDSDSSAILNEDNGSPNGVDEFQQHQVLMSPPSPSPSPSSMNCFQFQKTTYQSQYVKMEEHNFFSAEEACNFFSEDQAPTLQWYCSDNHWS